MQCLIDPSLLDNVRWVQRILPFALAVLTHEIDHDRVAFADDRPIIVQHGDRMLRIEL